MCDRRSAATSDRPRWTLLCAVALLPGTLLALLQAVPLAPGPRGVLELGTIVVGFGAIGWWARANRVGLDQLDWCECAGRTVTVRVIASGETHPIGSPPAHPVSLTVAIARGNSDAVADAGAAARSPAPVVVEPPALH